jgi:hypothetical protein
MAPNVGLFSGKAPGETNSLTDVHVPDDTRSRSRRPKSEAEKKTSWVSRCPQSVQSATRVQLQIGAKSVTQRERRTNHNIGITATPAPAGVQAASIALRSPFVPTASPDIPISELVSRRTTVETPGSLNPQPARRGRIREDATVPQPSVIPTRTSPGRLSPRAPTASPDSTSARRSQRLEPKRPRTSTST